eukprot:TRINITY_DN32303_c0_g1_i1.p1 TRINITY_DN32303_c0_g1~~TRINITY_DN32303_c0_g1_i1.p1  ORF type:complete len:247 (+),score=56.05 TRINITY_DN32303_c0_g1_i1:100-741(+)
MPRKSAVWARGLQKRGISTTRALCDKHFRRDEWTPSTYQVDQGARYLMNRDTTIHEFMLYQHRLNRNPGTIDGRVGKFLETLQKNIGYVSLRSKAFNYSAYYYYTLMNQIASNLLFAYRLQPVIMHKVHHLIQYFHVGHTMENKSIMRKPVNYRYFWLWWLTRRSYKTPVYTFDKWVYTQKMAKGDVNIPKMAATPELLFRRLKNAFDSSGSK